MAVDYRVLYEEIKKWTSVKDNLSNVIVRVSVVPGEPNGGVQQNRCSARVYLLAGRNSIFIRLGNMWVFFCWDKIHILNALVLCKQSDPWKVSWKE